VKHFFSRRIPLTGPILLVESGSRFLLENLIPGVRSTWGDQTQVDLVTCYPGMPQGFSADTTRVYRVTDYRDRRGELIRDLAKNKYALVGIICSAERIMTKWKWLIALRLPAKVFALNENGDYFYFDWSHWATMRQFMLFRAGLAGAGAVRTLARLFLFPFSLIYLILYAAAVHLRRAMRKTQR